MLDTTAPRNRDRLFFGSFLAMIAIGMGFSARAAILGKWGAQFGFTKTELGVITGFGLTGFGLTVMLFSVLVEHWGYRVMLFLTFAFHVLSGLITLMATPIFHAYHKDGAFYCLVIGTTIFSVGCGAAEAAVNPLIAALYPTQRTHRLNALHAGFPGGLVLGALVGVLLPGSRWEVILLMYLVPTLIWGLLLLGESFPPTQARANQINVPAMLREFRSPLLFVLLLLMAMVGFVELGTDSWIANITGALMEKPSRGLYLFIWTSSLMFLLRFVAGPIVKLITPLGLLLCAACLGTIGLVLLGNAGAGFNIHGAIWSATIAATIYGVGKTFYWGTMLGVTAERFPRGGALVLGAMGCVGNLSAGILGGPAIGFMQDRYASRNLEHVAPAAFTRYESDNANSFLLFFHSRGLDSSKTAILADNGAQLDRDEQALKTSGGSDANIARLVAWWNSAKTFAAADRGPVLQSTLFGSRMALIRTALVPGAMIVIFLLLILHFRSIGGYRQIHLAPMQAEALAHAAGVGDDA